MIEGLRREAVGFAGIVERNTYLIRRFVWWEVAWFLYTVANTLTIVFIAKGVEAAGGNINVNDTEIVLLIGAVLWSYLGLVFEIVTETVAWERWEGTIEYTFMAPLSRPAHLLGMGAFAVVYGVIRTIILFALVAYILGVHFTDAELRLGDGGAAVLVDLVRGHRHDDGGAAADLAREGHPARLHRPGDAAGRLGRLLPGQRAPSVDAVARDDLSRDLHARGLPPRDPGGAGWPRCGAICGR